MTEEDAKTKWCPKAFPRAEYEDEKHANRHADGRPLDTCMCIASGCMMWVEEKMHEDGDINKPMVVIGGFCGFR